MKDAFLFAAAGALITALALWLVSRRSRRCFAPCVASDRDRLRSTDVDIRVRSEKLLCAVEASGSDVADEP